METIRQMREEDLDQVAQLEAETFSTPWSRESLLSFWQREDTVFLAAERDGEIVGYCGYLQIFDEADILNVAVKEAYRNRRIGTRLVEKLIETGKDRGVSQFTLEVRQSNKRAIHIYEKMGFVSAGIRKNFYERPAEHAVIMWKR